MRFRALGRKRDPRMLDFYLIAAEFFGARVRSAFAESWRQRSFAPCRDLCRAVLERARPSPPPDSLLPQAASSLAFAPEFWRALIGEVLVFGCTDMPLLQTAPDTLCCMLAPSHFGTGDQARSAFTPIQQAHFGSRDLQFGGAFYRPDHAGWNDEGDVRRLLDYLENIDPGTWHEAMLRSMHEFPTVADREEELAFVRDWWPALVGLYRRAAGENCIIVCEVL